METSYENLERFIVETINSRNVHVLIHILEDLKIDPDLKRKGLGEISIFEKVLTVPRTQILADICLQNGSNFFKKNDNNQHPLHFAVKSFCAQNLKFLIAKGLSNNLNGDRGQKLFDNLKFKVVVNEKVDNESNYLHFLADNLTNENFEETSTMIEILLASGCCPATHDDFGQTPFMILQNKLKKLCISDQKTKSIIDLFAKYMRSEDLIGNPTINFQFILNTILDWNQKEFLKSFGNFVSTTDEWKKFSSTLMEEAVTRNLSEVISVLIKFGSDVNEKSENSKIQMTPAFIAAAMGHHESLKVLLSGVSVEFVDTRRNCNLLHQNLKFSNSDISDIRKCFKLLINDIRCDLNIINQPDGEGNFPLVYACQLGDEEIVKELLKRGAYVGHESIIEKIDKNTFEQFLDENIVKSGKSKFFMDFKFLMPAQKDCSELQAMTKITQNPRLCQLIAHPVLATFLELKWVKINTILYFNLILYFSFMLFLGASIVNLFHLSNDSLFDEETCLKLRIGHFWALQGAIVFDEEFCPNISYNQSELEHKPCGLYNGTEVCENFDPTFENEEERDHYYEMFIKPVILFNRTWEVINGQKVYIGICIAGLVILALYEVIQFIMTWKKYFLKFSNILDVSLISLSLYLLIVSVVHMKDEVFRVISSVLILLMGLQCLKLISKVSAFSLSLYMAILDQVVVTFLKTTAPYLIIIIAFGMSFYALNFDHSQNIIFYNSYWNENDSNVSRHYMKYRQQEEKLSDENITNQDNCVHLILNELNLKLTNHSSGLSFIIENLSEHIHDSKKEEKLKNGFVNPFYSVISTVRMMLADYEAVNITNDDFYKATLVLLFMILISIILLNLLNALAISDTQAILKVAEFVDIRKRVSTLDTFEKMFSFFRLKYLDIFPDITKVSVSPQMSPFVLRMNVSRSSDNPGYVSTDEDLKMYLELNVVSSVTKTWEPMTCEKWMIWRKYPTPLKFSKTFMENLENNIKIVSQRNQKPIHKAVEF